MKTPGSTTRLTVALTGAFLSVTTLAATKDPADWWPNAEGMRSMADYFPSATVETGEPVHVLQWGEPLPQTGPGGVDLDAFNRDNLSTGMIVLHKGRIVYENYWQGADEESLFSSFSMAKSVTSTLIGIAEAEGHIRSLDDPIVRYVPELAETAYRNVTIEQALQMSSGVRYEASVTLESDEILLTCVMLPPGPVFADCESARSSFGDVKGFLASLTEAAAAPGTTFNYSTSESQVLGWVLENATGQSAAEYLSEKIWKPLGMEADAAWLLDPEGTTLTGAGLNARLRDYARFGLLLANDGVHEGKRLLPEGWIERATVPSQPHLQHIDPVVGYQYQWWTLANGAFEAQGTNGQFLRVDPEHELVIVKTSAWQGAWDMPKALQFLATIDSIVAALDGR